MGSEDRSDDREEALFLAALELTGSERAAFLDRAGATDPALRRRLEALLAAHAEEETLLRPLPAGKIGAAAPRGIDEHDPAIDATLGGRYRILEKIGEGGCGVVYLAEQIEPVRRRVALKVIKPGMDSNAVIARFQGERQALAMMDHPYIASVFDAGMTDETSPLRSHPEHSERSPVAEGHQEPLRVQSSPSAASLAGGRPYFVMEWVQGKRITDYCDHERLSLRERLELFIKICEAIQHAHQKGIIHRDIKPSNILVTRPAAAAEPTPKVIDFGIAKAIQGRLTDATAQTEALPFLGTPAYMSPEQADSQGLDIDTRTDIYSLGILLYELIAGRPPFDSKELLASGIHGMRRTICEREPPRPSARLTSLEEDALRTALSCRQADAGGLIRQLRGDLDWIVMKCLEKDRARRYETPSALAADLRRHLDHEPVTARPPSTIYRLRKGWRRHRIAFSAALTVAGVLVASVAVLSWALREQTTAREAAEDARIEEGRQRTRAEAARAAASAERDRAARLLAAAQAAQGVERLERNDPAGLLHLLEARRTVDHLPEERARFTLLWSGWMESLPKPETRALQSSNWLSSLGYSLSGPWMATGSTNGEVTIWRATTGEEIGRFRAGDVPVFSPEFSGNGRLLIISVHGRQQLWDLGRSLSNQWPSPLVRRIHRYAFDPNRRLLVTLSNEGLPVPGEEDPDSRPPFYRVQIWNSELDEPLVATWTEDRLDIANHRFALSPDGRLVASGEQSLTLWDAATGKPHSVQLTTDGIAGASDYFSPVCFSPNGRWLWEVRRGSCVRYEVSTGKPAGDPLVGLDLRNRPWVSPEGRHMVVRFEAGHRVVRLDTGEFTGPLIPRDEDTAVVGRALSADGRRLLTSGLRRGVQVWDTQTGLPLASPIVLPAGTADAKFSPDGEWLGIVTHDGRSHIQRLSAPEPATFRTWPGLWLIGLNAEGQGLAFTRSNRFMQWIDLWNGSGVRPNWEPGESGKLYGAALSPDARIVATATETAREQSVVRLWEASTGAPIRGAISWTNIGNLAFSPDGRSLGGLGADGSIHVWDVATGELRSRMGWPQPAQLAWIGLRFSPDSRFVAARNSYAISVWDTVERRPANGLDLHEGFYLAISADWSLALNHRDLLVFTDPRNPQPAPLPPGSRSAPADRGGFAISPDGRLRASTPENKEVRMWDIATGRPVGRPMTTDGAPMRMEFSPDSRLLAVLEIHFERSRPGPRHTLRLWETSSGLPCGPAMPVDDFPIEFWFHPQARLLAYSTLYDPSGARVFRLPDAGIALADMERTTWQITGSRMDETGNIELIPPE